MIDEVVKLIGCHPLGPRKESDKARIEIASAHPHDQPGGRREAHGRLDGMAPVDRRQARTGSRVRQDDASPGLVRAGDACQFFHEIRIRQAMKAITPDSGGLIPPGYRHDLSDAGHIVMKSGVEARNLG